MHTGEQETAVDYKSLLGCCLKMSLLVVILLTVQGA